MAEANPKVMEMVQAELSKNPDITNKELFEKAKGIDKSAGKLSARQFNARYPLQVKRTMAPKAKKKSRRPAAKGRKPATGGRGRKGATAAAPADAGRDRVRTLLLELARDVANAQGKGDVVDVIVGIDRYVDRVIKAAG
jgi:hypothetical protein